MRPSAKQLSTLLFTAVMVASLALQTSSPALAAQEQMDIDTIIKIRDEGLNNSQVMENISWLTDVYGPRLTGSPQIEQAKEWTIGKFEEWGLSNIREERFDFGKGWEVVRFNAHMTEPQVMPIIGYPRSWSSSTDGVVKAEVEYVTLQTAGDLDRYRGNLEGKIVFLQPIREVEMLEGDVVLRMTDELKAEARTTPVTAAGGGGGFRGRGGRGGGGAEGADRPLNRTEINDFLYEENVAVLIDRGSDSTEPAGGSSLSWATQRTDGGTIFPGGGGPRDENAGQVVASATIAVEHYNRMMRILEKGIPVEMEVDIQTRFHEETQPNGFNIIAEIPGTDLADEIVMIGGHFDSTHGAVGATDNATGVAAMMEVMRIFKTLGIQPRRTVRIGLWGGEEQGLIGSRVHVTRNLASRDMTEMHPDYDNFSAYFNIDNGTGRIVGIWLQGNLAVKPIFEQWMTMLDDLGMDTAGPRSVGGTDHGSFDAVGLPGFQFMQDRLEYNSRTHHSNMDFFDRVQEDHVVQQAVVAAVFAYNAAMRDVMLPLKPLVR
jgi:carboxypeptidase Q